MGSYHPSPLTHSWPLFEREKRFGLDGVLEGAGGDSGACLLEHMGVGQWQCDLGDNSLSWTDRVYDLFGLPRGSAVARAAAVAMYEEGSRAAMESLRDYALRHRRGFTLDAEIEPADGGKRCIRIVAAPICVDGRPVRLQGYKWDVTADYKDVGGPFTRRTAW